MWHADDGKKQEERGEQARKERFVRNHRYKNGIQQGERYRSKKVGGLRTKQAGKQASPGWAGAAQRGGLARTATLPLDDWGLLLLAVK